MVNFWGAFLITLLAGLATGIGSLIAFFVKSTNTKFLSASLGFSAGVMLYVSMIEIFKESNHSFINMFGIKAGTLITIFYFFAGILFIALIDRYIPDEENPHELLTIGEIKNEKEKKYLYRTGLFTALAIVIHNFPEGISTFVSAMESYNLAIPIAIAIAIHNIPEGISVSVPIYYATGSRLKAFTYSFLSGMSEPIGGLLGYLLLRNFMNEIIMSGLLAAVAGIMVYISIDELLPAARKYGDGHTSIYGMIVGMLVMALSLVLFM